MSSKDNPSHDKLLVALAEVMTKDSIEDWLKTPNELFDGFKPLEVIERGDDEVVWQMIYALRSGELS